MADNVRLKKLIESLLIDGNAEGGVGGSRTMTSRRWYLSEIVPPSLGLFKIVEDIDDPDDVQRSVQRRDEEARISFDISLGLGSRYPDELLRDILRDLCWAADKCDVLLATWPQRKEFEQSWASAIMRDEFGFREIRDADEGIEYGPGGEYDGGPLRLERSAKTRAT